MYIITTFLVLTEVGSIISGVIKLIKAKNSKRELDIK